MSAKKDATFCKQVALISELSFIAMAILFIYFLTESQWKKYIESIIVVF